MRVAVCLSVFACLIGGRAPQSDTTQTWRQLEQRYAVQDSAIARRDLAAFLATLSPAYFVELRNGQRFTRPGIDSAIARDMRLTLSVRDVGTVIETLTVRGDTLVAMVRHRADRTLRDGQGQPHRWENAVRHEETWARSHGAWHIVALREREQIHLRRDGVPITQ